jgi:HPt (histidine-containing phosphotransfer) domain-containing protein
MQVAAMVDHELNELRREFLDEARGKVNEMESVLQTGSNGPAYDRLAYLAHQLKGSGGSYGYQRISDDAAQLEKAVESTAASADLQRFVVSLREEIDRAARELV